MDIKVINGDVTYPKELVHFSSSWLKEGLSHDQYLIWQFHEEKFYARIFYIGQMPRALFEIEATNLSFLEKAHFHLADSVFQNLLLGRTNVLIHDNGGAFPLTIEGEWEFYKHADFFGMRPFEYKKSIRAK